MIILTLNCGSSSVKYLLYDWASNTELVRGIIERIGERSSKITQQTMGEAALTKTINCPDHETAIREISDLIFSSKKLPDRSSVKGVGHRVVHGGEEFNKPTVINTGVLKKIKSLIELAPLHNPPNIAGIEGAMKAFPDIPHVAIFDTAFHQSMPEVAYLYCVPYEWYEKYGIRRFGFHGTSHAYVSRKAAAYFKKDKHKMITMHIGAGVSLTAIKNGKSVDTSMGFTPLEGLPMATRSGNIDPTVVTYISEKTDTPVDKVLDILNKKSGLLGITGKYTDRRDIKKAAQEGDKLCQIALKLQTYHLIGYIGAYTAVMGGLDILVFTAGAGENDTELRADIVNALEYQGVKLDIEKNNAAKGGKDVKVISADDSTVKVCVVPTNEEYAYVEAVINILQGGKVK